MRLGHQTHVRMQNQVSMKPLDKVEGLAYLLYSDSIPIYNAEKSDTDTWEVLMDALWSWSRVEFFFYFSEPGKGRKYWQPSWQQIMLLEHFVPYSCFWIGDVSGTEDTDEDQYYGYCIDSVDVQGLAEGLTEEKPRQGEMVFNDAAGSSHTLKIVAAHTYPIPDGSYALIGCSFIGSSDVCVVGW